MRKIFLSLILILCLVPVSFAAPSYGTNLPEKNKFIAEFESYSIFGRDLENDYGEVKSQQEFFGLSYGIFDWLSIDLKAGAGNIKADPNASSKVDYPTSFAGGYGFRLKFYDEEKIRAVMGFQHISVHPRHAHAEGVKNRAILDDWQVSLLGSYSLGRVTPYIGARWSRIDYIHWTGENRKRIMSDLGKSTGLIVGVDLPVTENIFIDLEGQFFDSEALACSVKYNF